MKKVSYGMSRRPLAPNGVTVVPVSCSRVMVKWNHQNGDKDTPIHKYVLQRHAYYGDDGMAQESAYSNGNWYIFGLMDSDKQSPKGYDVDYGAFSWVTVMNSSSLESSFMDFGLQKETTYRYRVCVIY